MMKRLICLITAFAFMLWTIPVINSAEVKKDTLLLLGDSIAYGYGIKEENSKYGNIVADEYDFLLVNDSVVGDDTSDLLNLIKEKEEVKSHITEGETIVISIGGNDFLGLRYNSSVPQLAEIIAKGKDSEVLVNMLKRTKKNINSIHKRIRDINPKARIVLQTVYNPFQGQSDSFTSMLCQVVELIRKDFTKIYFDEAKDDDNMVIADVESVFRDYYDSPDYDGTEIVQSDYVHPTAQGHRMIANVVEDAIDDVHRAGWTTIKRSADCILRLSERFFDD